MPKSPPLTDRRPTVSIDPTEPAIPQASSIASQDASLPESPKEKMIGKSYRFPLSHARAFAAWTAARGLTEQEATRLGQVWMMEHYDDQC